VKSEADVPVADCPTANALAGKPQLFQTAIAASSAGVEKSNTAVTGADAMKDATTKCPAATSRRLSERRLAPTGPHVKVKFQVVLPQNFQGEFTAKSIDTAKFKEEVVKQAKASGDPKLANLKVADLGDVNFHSFTKNSVTKNPESDGAQPMVSMPFTAFVAILVALAGRHFL